MARETTPKCIDVGNEEVCVGDSFKVIEKNSSLIGVVDVGEEFTINCIKQTPSGFEAQTTIDGYKYNFSPTTLAEALCEVDYPSAPEEPCIERID